jgi:polysaccharide biosynthesis protein PslH
MRILFITSRLPYPPNRGDRLRAFNFIKSLHREYEIYLISFISNAIELKHLPALEQYCKDIKLIKKRPIKSALSVILNFWKPEPLQSLYYRSSKMSSIINHTLVENPIDVVYVHLFRMAQFVIDQEHHYRILDLTDVISEEIKRSLPYRNFVWKLLYSIEYSRIERYEKKLANLFDEIWLISKAEQNKLKSQTSQSNILTITNGIDTQIFHPIDVNPIPYSLIFTGHMGIPHNIDAARFFALEVLPGIQKVFPESTFIIAGAEPARSVLDLSYQPNVKVLGYVEDLNYELNRAQIFVAPLRFAAGVQNKVLEAMAAGRPVITTSIVNEGINAKADEDIIIADTPDEYIMKISRLFSDRTLQEKIGLSGENFVRNNFSWDFVSRRMNYLESKITSNRKQ